MHPASLHHRHNWRLDEMHIAAPFLLFTTVAVLGVMAAMFFGAAL